MTSAFFIAKSIARQLRLLQSTVTRIESHERATQGAADSWLGARLAPDMLSLGVQIQIAANLALRTVYPLANRSTPAFGAFGNTAAGAQAHIAHALALVEALNELDFASTPARIAAQAGDEAIDLSTDEFIHQFALPNFHFHCAMVHAIGRQLGVTLGKRDFDGLHSYDNSDTHSPIQMR